MTTTAMTTMELARHGHKLRNTMDDNDDNVMIPGFLRGGVEVETGAVLVVAVTVTMVAADR
jgi:hypothetical protein